MFHAEPYLVYHAYRQVHSVQLGLPVQPGDEPVVWHIFGYREAVQGLKDPATLRGPLMDNRSELPPGAFSILMMDPPDHMRLRQLFSRTFTPRALERFLPMLESGPRPTSTSGAWRRYPQLLGGDAGRE